MRSRSIERRCASRERTCGATLVSAARRASPAADRESESVTSRVKNASKSLLMFDAFCSTRAAPSVVEQRDRRGAACDSELLLQLRDMPAHRDRRDAELLGDAIRRIAAAKQRRDLPLACGQPGLAAVAAEPRAGAPAELTEQ